MLPVHLPRLKAPRNHGELLVHPPLDAVADLLRDNRDRFGGSLLGRSFADLRQLARQETQVAANSYLAAAGEPSPASSSEIWLVAGHQPELFHPGVWVKNFLLEGLARRHAAVALNLVVDNDIAKTASLRVPTNERVVNVPFDEPSGEIPFEERTVHDEATFSSFPERIETLTRDWPFRPWVRDVWAEMQRAARGTPLLGERIVRARRALERSMGLSPREAPLSCVCRTTAFAWFACGLLADAPRFVSEYNAAVHEYRQLHDLKSKNHPVPDLAIRDGAYEAPLWLWRPAMPRRQRLFAAVDRTGLQLFAGTTPIVHLDGAPEQWIAAWPTLEAQGIKIRTRALATTLFTRLLLADLFIHGIGGGKYDEVTDAIIERYFGRKPPHYLVATATLLLPFPRRAVGELDDRAHSLSRLGRDLWFNPQRHLLDGDERLRHAIERKFLATSAAEETHEQRVERFHRLQEATADLRPFVNSRVEAVKRELEEVEALARHERLFGTRDYSFCLYPRDMLESFLRQAAS